MAELDKINVNGELYDMSDSKARSDIASEITNRTTADMILTSNLFANEDYTPIIPKSIENYKNRKL